MLTTMRLFSPVVVVIRAMLCISVVRCRMATRWLWATGVTLLIGWFLVCYPVRLLLSTVMLAPFTRWNAY